jgi:hypothetical protein
MRVGFVLGMALMASVGVLGCKRKVPDDIVNKAFDRVLRSHAPNTVSAMCGGQTRGFTSVKTTIKSRLENNKGMVHVKGTPWMSTKGDKLPRECEGDLEYQFSYTTKKIGRSTNTTWYLDHVKLVAVQTPGVSLKTVDEDTDDTDDDDEPSAKK